MVIVDIVHRTLVLVDPQLPSVPYPTLQRQWDHEPSVPLETTRDIGGGRAVVVVPAAAVVVGRTTTRHVLVRQSTPMVLVHQWIGTRLTIPTDCVGIQTIYSEYSRPEW